MLDAAEALLFRRRDELAVADERGRRIAVEGVEAENDQSFACCKRRRLLCSGVRTGGLLCRCQASMVLIAKVPKFPGNL